MINYEHCLFTILRELQITEKSVLSLKQKPFLLLSFTAATFFFNDGRISVQLWSSLVVNSLNSLQEVCWEEGTILGWGGGLSLDLGNKGAVAKLWDFLYVMDAVTWPGQCICGRYSDISVMRMIQSDAEQTRVLTWSRHLLFSSLVLHHANEES